MTSTSCSSHVKIKNNGNDWDVLAAYVNNGLLGSSSVDYTCKFYVKFTFGGLDSSGVMHNSITQTHDYTH